MGDPFEPPGSASGISVGYIPEALRISVIIRITLAKKMGDSLVNESPGGKWIREDRRKLGPPTVQVKHSAFKTITQSKNHNYLKIQGVWGIRS